MILNSSDRTMGEAISRGAIDVDRRSRSLLNRLLRRLGLVPIIKRTIWLCGEIPPELAELTSAFASFNVGILALIQAFTSPQTPDSLKAAASGRMGVGAWAFIFIAFGTSKFLAYKSRNVRARQGVAFAGFYVWSLFTMLVWSSHPEAIFARGVAPVFALSSAITIFRLGKIEPNGRSHNARKDGGVFAGIS